MSPSTAETVAEFASEMAAVANATDPVIIAQEAARRLPRLLANPFLLTIEQRKPEDDGYAQRLLHVDDRGRFSIIALVWKPGQATPVHDHVAWCVVGVYEGEELETRYRVEETNDERRLVPVGTARHGRGDVVWLVPDREGDLHRVSNPTDATAISIHVYGADIRRLGSSIRRRYPLPSSARPEVEA